MCAIHLIPFLSFDQRLGDVKSLIKVSAIQSFAQFKVLNVCRKFEEDWSKEVEVRVPTSNLSSKICK